MTTADPNQTLMWRAIARLWGEAYEMPVVAETLYDSNKLRVDARYSTMDYQRCVTEVRLKLEEMRENKQPWAPTPSLT